MSCKLAIVCPCYNEEEVLRDSVLRLEDFLNQQISANIIAKDSFVMLVNDGSTDET